MKRTMILILLVALILCGCKSKTSTQNPEPQKTEPIVQTPPVELVDNSNEYPIIVADKISHSEGMRIVGFCTDGAVTGLDEYRYGEKTLRHFKGQDDLLNQTTIVDLSRTIKLVGRLGNTVEVQPSSMSCTERMLDETLEFTVAFGSPWTDENGIYLGTYSDIDIFPKEITYQEESIQVDLDGNGQMDSIDWSFSPTTTYYEVKLDYVVSVTRNGETYPLVEDNYIPLEKEDLAIFVADLNQDGEFEILVYARGMSKFGYLAAYTFSNNQYSIMIEHTVLCQP